ncbi:MAG: zinc-ribbon domain-containing protein, partial [Candidatus Peribacteraceae bacterium]|nr:zinc-ribbon domain-containing protein [Candidatus Peribacteraceae bacterium]
MVWGNRKSLKETHPHLLEEWDYAKNGNLLPENVTFGSHKKVWWTCLNEDCNHRWKAMTKNRTRKIKPVGCPVCVRQAVIDKNNLKVLFPDLCEEWDSKKNKIRSTEVSCGSNKKVWWLCSNEDCGHSWVAVIKSRTTINKPCSCPVCARGSVSKVSQKWLDGLGIKVREHYIKDLKIRVD